MLRPNYLNTSNTNRKRPFFLAALTLIALSLLISTLIYTKNGSAQPQETQQVLGSDTHSAPQRPFRLRIPKIEVSAVIEYVGTAADGTMESPHFYNNVGWFDQGTYPGQVGSAVIAGHLTNTLGEAGVFSNLALLEKGDTVFVEHDDGSETEFSVTHTLTLEPGRADAVFSQDNGAFLNLITCEGSWNSTKKSYTKRLVVFTELVNK